eukprot:5759381-Heterocapsa_arctica.AAC.1
MAEADLGHHERREAPGERGDKVAKPRRLEYEGVLPARRSMTMVEPRRKTLSRGRYKMMHGRS